MENLKRKLCNHLIENDLVKENDVIRHSYTNSRMRGEFKDIRENNICPTLDTRCDCLGVVVNTMKKPRVIGGIGEKKSNSGRQYYMQDRIYDGDYALAIATSINPYYVVGEEMEENKENTFVEKKYKEFIEEKGYVPNAFNPYNKAEIKDIAPTQTTNCGSTTSSATVLIKSKDKTKNLIEDVQNGKYDKDKTYGKYLFQSSKFNDKPLEELSTTIKSSKVDSGIISNLRIRKLTPKECWLLMGFDSEDFEKASQMCSSSQLYKQAGNSIVVNVLEEIFKQLLCA
jgi:DNA (cytosine-5)-methyltransferase 1